MRHTKALNILRHCRLLVGFSSCILGALSASSLLFSPSLQRAEERNSTTRRARITETRKRATPGFWFGIFVHVHTE